MVSWHGRPESACPSGVLKANMLFPVCTETIGCRGRLVTFRTLSSFCYLSHGFYGC